MADSSGEYLQIAILHAVERPPAEPAGRSVCRVVTFVGIYIPSREIITRYSLRVVT